MSALLFDGKRCRLCDRYIPQKPRYKDVHIAMHVRRGEAEIRFINHRQHVVLTDAEAARLLGNRTANDTPRAENEPLHNADNTGSLRG